MALPAKKKTYTFADYMAWGEDERMELLEGEAVLLAAPSRLHQRISVELSRQLANFLEGKKCQLYTAPFAVRLFEKEGDLPEDVETVVEPDLTVVCDPKKLDRYGCRGAPELVLEILSPSSARRDRLVKFGLYQRAGVGELWLVSPEERTVQVFLLEESILTLREVYGAGDIAKVNTLEGCFIQLDKVFRQHKEVLP